MKGGACCAPARDGAPAPPAPQVTGGGADVAKTADIPGGAGLIGTARPLFPVDGEGPLRKTRIKPFRIDVEAVTVARFAAFVAATGYVTEAERFGDGFVFAGDLDSDTARRSRPHPAAHWWRLVEGADWRRPNGPTGEAAPEDHPVTQVTWADARAFAAWAGGRLPTEAEWEHAARGGLGDVAYPWGDKAPGDDGPYHCNIWQGAFPARDLGRDGWKGTAPARSFAPNGFGLFNMVGNVWEWCADPFRVRSLKKAHQAAHAGKEGFRLLKGGSFMCHASYCHRYRIAARSGSSPDSATSHQGFRLVYAPAR